MQGVHGFKIKLIIRRCLHLAAPPPQAHKAVTPPRSMRYNSSEQCGDIAPRSNSTDCNHEVRHVTHHPLCQ